MQVIRDKVRRLLLEMVKAVRQKNYLVVTRTKRQIRYGDRTSDMAAVFVLDESDVSIPAGVFVFCVKESMLICRLQDDHPQQSRPSRLGTSTVQCLLGHHPVETQQFGAQNAFRRFSDDRWDGPERKGVTKAEQRAYTGVG